jgi:hypothetical protein
MDLDTTIKGFDLSHESIRKIFEEVVGTPVDDDWKIHGGEIRPVVLKEALFRTSEKRGSHEVLTRYDSILSDVLASEQMQGFWEKYRSDFDYAADIPFAAAVDTAKEILAWR